MRHVLIAAGLLLASLLVVQVVVAAFQVSATRGHEVSANFVPGELPRSALPAVLGPGTRARAALPERARPQQPSTQPLDYRQRTTPVPLDTLPQQPAAQERPPSQPPTPGSPPSLKLPSPPIRDTAPPGADRA